MTGVNDHSQRAHARLAPSASHRWMNCPGSPAAEAEFEDQSSEYAMHGTAAHELGELCGKKNIDPEAMLGDDITVEGRSFEVDREMVDGVSLYVDTIRGDFEDGDILEWERRYKLPFLPGENFGTADATRYRPSTKKLTVYDLKYGAGVPVEAINNSQGLCYAGGAAYALNLPINEVEIVIIQPRAYHADGPVRRWSLPGHELASRLFELGKAAERTYDADAPRNAGDWCRWCKAQATCPTLSMTCLAEAQMIFEGTPVEPETLTPEQLGETLGKISLMKSWIKAVDSYAYKLANEGVEIPGWKLVAKRALRKWYDEEKAAEELRKLGLTDDDLFVRKLASPAQAEKMISSGLRSAITSLTIKESSGTTLAPSSDKREAVDLNGANVSVNDYRNVFAKTK